jgi:hypothetical protein
MSENLQKLKFLVEKLDDRDRKLKNNSAVLWCITEKLCCIKDKVSSVNPEAAKELGELIKFIESNGCREALNEC